MAVMDNHNPLTKVWNTNDIHQREQFAYWNDAVCSSIMKLELERRQSGIFKAELVAHQAGEIVFNQVCSDEHVAQLNLSGISRLNDYHFYLLIQKTGQLFSTQHGVENHILPGDSIIVDSLYPFELNFPKRFECISVKIPRALLHPKLADARQLCTSKMHRGSHLSQAIFHYIRFILSDVVIDNPQTTANKIETFLNLIAISGASPNHEGSSALLSPIGIQQLQQMKGFVRQNFDSELTPTHVANHFNISVNYLHKLFAQDDTTFGEYVRKTRLEHASKLLANPEHYRLTVSTIALLTGFNDLSHFYRVFKQKFGVTPGAYRKLRR